MTDERIPFNRPFTTGREAAAVTDALSNAHLSADGPYTARCRDVLMEWSGSSEVLLVHSCTAALEIAALVSRIGPGDEVIMPSFTFVTTATAFALRGAVPVFVDVEPGTLNIDPAAVARAIGPRTRAIAVVHYAGVGCDMDPILQLAEAHGIGVIEDAAQGYLAARDGRPLGTRAPLGAISFHETKNVTCGEGGALLVNDPALVDDAVVIRDKGTNRRRFERGEVQKYEWVGLGSSYGLSDLQAAVLWEQLQVGSAITDARLRLWARYRDAFTDLVEAGRIRGPVVPDQAVHNGHMFYLLLRDGTDRDRVLDRLGRRGINAVFHYVPLHSSPAGKRYGRVGGSLTNTDDAAQRLIRLPLYAGMTDAEQDRVIVAVAEALA